MKSRFVCAALAAALMLGLGGCSTRQAGLYANYRRIESLLPVQALGWDCDAQEDTLTAAANAAAGGSDSGSDASSGETPQSRRITCRGAGIPAAMEQLQAYAAQENLFYAHAEFVLVGEQAAAQGLYPLVDFLLRGSQLRSDAQLFLVRGDTAQTLICGAGTGDYAIDRVLTALSWDVERYGTNHVTTCGEVAAALAETGAALICAVRVQPLEGTVPDAPEGCVTALADGYGVIRDGQLAGWLDGRAALGAGLLQGRTGAGSCRLDDGRGGIVTVQLGGGKTDCTPVWENGTLAGLELTLETRAAVTAMERPLALEDPAVRASLCRQLCAELEARACSALSRSAALEADFLDLGGRIRASDAEAFAALDWPAALAGLPVTVTVRTSLEQSFDLQQAPILGGTGVDGYGR